ncbi:hypothetical protein [Ascidiimonas aurantiaca]|uniref:hypothetical protein n=1 Tax=Ascidiimonas aurantiaca TaxID=1685432 RepID=UPI0030EF7788
MILEVNPILSDREIRDKVFLSLREYLSRRSFPSHIQNEILDEGFIEANPKYYLYYPYLFSDFFDIKDEAVLIKLSVAGFLYYKATIFFDEIFDKSYQKGAFQKFVVGNICQEETVKILSSIFPLDSKFWFLWNMRKSEFAKAFQMGNVAPTISSMAEYEKLADYKCAFGKIALDALFSYSGFKNEKIYTALLESHKSFYVAFQILDDIADFEEDLEENQFNIACFKLEEHFSAKRTLLNNYSAKERKKMLFLDGLAQELYYMALDYLKKAKQTSLIESDQEKGHFWHSEIQKLHNTSVIHNLNIKGYINHFQKITQEASGKTTKNSGDALERAISYLVKEQENNGSWIDYFNDAGVSDVWTTGYLGSFLSSLEASEVMSKSLKKAYAFMHKSKWESTHCWGYNTSWIPDADSTSFGILFSWRQTKKISSETLAGWKRYQNPDGGFSTYNDASSLKASLNIDKIINVEGWMQSHFCVSAVAYYVFCNLGIRDNQFELLEKYVIRELHVADHHHAYWWNDFFYVISFLLKGAVLTKNQIIINLCQDYIDQNKENLIEMENAFYCGLLLDALVVEKTLFQKNKELAVTLAALIEKRQNPNGSWHGNLSLRMPHPEILNPGTSSIDWIPDTKGTNILVKDFNGFFTTVVCLSSLYHFRKY